MWVLHAASRAGVLFLHPRSALAEYCSGEVLLDLFAPYCEARSARVRARAAAQVVAAAAKLLGEPAQQQAAAPQQQQQA